jgi:DNA-binding IclR family transcriptional regulator
MSSLASMKPRSENRRSSKKNRSRDPITRALALLRTRMEDPTTSLGVRDAAAMIGTSPSSAHRLLSALTKEGMLRREAGGRYSLGLEVVRLAHVMISRMPLRDVALRYMRKLVTSCNETVYFGLYDRARQEIFFGTNVESSQRLRYVVDTEHWVPVYAGASGLAVMAYLSDEERESIIRRTRLKPLTPATISEPYRLEHALANVRRMGYALTRGQRIPGAVGLAAPVFGPDGEVVGDISITIPEQRYDPANESRLADLVMQCAGDVTIEIGGVRPLRSRSAAGDAA